MFALYVPLQVFADDTGKNNRPLYTPQKNLNKLDANQKPWTPSAVSKNGKAW